MELEKYKKRKRLHCIKRVLLGRKELYGSLLRLFHRMEGMENCPCDGCSRYDLCGDYQWGCRAYKKYLMGIRWSAKDRRELRPLVELEMDGGR